MRWKKFIGGLALSLMAVTGCKQPVFMTEGDYQNTLSAQRLPTDLEENPDHGSVIPDLKSKFLPKPADIFDPDRPVRYLSLTEVFAQALENGATSLGVPVGQVNGDSPDAFGIGGATTLQGQIGPTDRDSIRVFSLEPAIQASGIEAALSKFDARWVNSMNWNTTDKPIGTAQDVLTSAGVNDIRTQAAELTSSLIKPLPTGGVAAITFDTQYQYTNLTAARVNPSYTPSVQFQFEQPLLQGFGVDINQIRADHPGSILNGTQFATTPRTLQGQEGIILSRIRFDQSRALLELHVEELLLNVEVAYWNLYAAYGQLYAREIALRKNLEVWRLTKERVEAGIKQFTQADLFESQGQYESSRSDWLAALGNVLDSERRLRGIMGLKAEDGTRLVPADPPTMAPLRPDWQTALQDTLALRPELAIMREQIKVHQLHLIDEKNRLLPDLRFTSTYNVNGIGSRLDGADATPGQGGNALRDLAADHFNSWTLGLRLDMPIGYRDANASLRIARMQLAQSYWALKTGEDKATRALTQQFRQVLEFQEQIQRNLAAMEAYNNELNVRIQRVKGGTDTPDVTLQAIRFGSAAMVQYYQFVGQYNATLAKFEFAKGTLLRRDNVTVADGPLPNCPQVRAVEHEQERALALPLRERSSPIPCDGHGDNEEPARSWLSVPDWLSSRSPLPEEPPKVAVPPTYTPPTWTKQRTDSAAEWKPATTLDQVKPAPQPAADAAPSNLLPAAPSSSLPAAPSSSQPAAPAPSSTLPSLPGTSSSFGVVRPLNFNPPEDRKAPGTLPALPGSDLGNGSR
jgi:outer membrane protein TolC